MIVNNALMAVSCKRCQDDSIAVQPTGSVRTGAALPIRSTDSARFFRHTVVMVLMSAYLRTWRGPEGAHHDGHHDDRRPARAGAERTSFARFAMRGTG